MIRVIHKQCGKAAFFFKKKVNPGDVLRASNIRLVDGKMAKAGGFITFGSCGLGLALNSQTFLQQHWTDWFMQQD